MLGRSASVFNLSSSSSSSSPVYLWYPPVASSIKKKKSVGGDEVLCAQEKGVWTLSGGSHQQILSVAGD